MARAAAAAILLFLCMVENVHETSFVAAKKSDVSPPVVEAKVLDRKHQRVKPPKQPLLHRAKKKQHAKTAHAPPRDRSDRRRVMPWVSIAILMNVLFFFRSFAAPFFDPLVSVFL